MFNPVKSWSIVYTLLLIIAISLIPDNSFAANGDTIGEVLCDVVSWFSGPVGKGIASLAIIILGVGALMGKVSWGMGITVAIGIAVIFGAGNIVHELVPQATGCPATSSSSSGGNGTSYCSKGGCATAQ